MAGQGRHRNVKGELRTCQYCGAEFEPFQANQLYCCPNHRMYAAQLRRFKKAFDRALFQVQPKKRG